MQWFWFSRTVLDFSIEWIKYKFGIFDEHGLASENQKMYPDFYRRGATEIRPNSCANARYGNSGCQLFKGGLQNKLDFFDKNQHTHKPRPCTIYGVKFNSEIHFYSMCSLFFQWILFCCCFIQLQKYQWLPL